MPDPAGFMEQAIDEVQAEGVFRMGPVPELVPGYPSPEVKRIFDEVRSAFGTGSGSRKASSAPAVPEELQDPGGDYPWGGESGMTPAAREAFLEARRIDLDVQAGRTDTAEEYLRDWYGSATSDGSSTAGAGGVTVVSGGSVSLLTVFGVAGLVWWLAKRRRKNG